MKRCKDDLSRLNNLSPSLKGSSLKGSSLALDEPHPEPEPEAEVEAEAISQRLSRSLKSVLGREAASAQKLQRELEAKQKLHSNRLKVCRAI